MTFYLEDQKESKLSSQERYDIISFAIDAAVDNGFVNSFIFGRAMYVYAAIMLYPERKDEISSLAAQNINDAWDTLMHDGTLENLTENYPIEVKLLSEEGSQWSEEFTKYSQSARGLLSTIQEFSGDIVQAAAEQLRNSATQSGVQNVIEIADKWGMNNTVEAPAAKPLPQDSVFE